MWTNQNRRDELAADPSLKYLITKRGRLTLYAFACGYCETAENENSNLRLYAEGGVFHVVGGIMGQSVWDCFDNLPDARKVFDATTKGWMK